MEVAAGEWEVNQASGWHLVLPICGLREGGGAMEWATVQLMRRMKTLYICIHPITASCKILIGGV